MDPIRQQRGSLPQLHHQQIHLPSSPLSSLLLPSLLSLFTHLIYFYKDRAKQMDPIRQQRGPLPQLHHQQIHPPSSPLSYLLLPSLLSYYLSYYPLFPIYSFNLFL
jgi:hypothetical protein